MSLPESDALDPELEADEPKPADDEQFEKPKAGVYTMLLIVSFFALLIGISCLHYEMKAYDFDFRAKKAKNEAPKGNQGAWHQPAAKDKAMV